MAELDEWQTIGGSKMRSVSEGRKSAGVDCMQIVLAGASESGKKNALPCNFNILRLDKKWLFV